MLPARSHGASFVNGIQGGGEEDCEYGVSRPAQSKEERIAAASAALQVSEAEIAVIERFSEANLTLDHLGAAIQNFRMKAGLTQHQMAVRLFDNSFIRRPSQSYVSKIEAGKNLTFARLCAFAKCLERSPALIVWEATRLAALDSLRDE